MLDFIGQAHVNYRFDVRYRALLDDPARPVQRQVEADFPYLPCRLPGEAGTHGERIRAAEYPPEPAQRPRPHAGSYRRR